MSRGPRWTPFGGRLLVTGVVVALVAATGCGGSDRSSGAASDGTLDHRSDLVIGETPFVTQFLVPVEGYSYVNANSAEIEGVLEQYQATEDTAGIDFFGGLSLHSVVADDPSQNTARAWNGDDEVGWFGLVQLNQPVPYGVDELYASSMHGGDTPIDRLEIAGVSVFVFEDPDVPDSRFTYSWLDHGVFGVIDGADRAPLERWLTAYLPLPKLAEHETEELAARLVAVPGFTYSNVDTSTLAEQFGALGDVAHSGHKVADRDGSIGILTLTGSDDPAFLEGWVTDTFGLEPSDELTLGGAHVTHFVGVVEGDQGHALTWTEAGMSGALTTNPGDLDTAEHFLEVFLAADST